MAEVKKVDLTTGIGTLSFPHVFEDTKTKNDKGEAVYDIQIIIPKTQRDDARAIMAAIKAVGEAKWGANWKKVRTPFRDGDAEADDLTEDGSTKGEKYPERLGAWFLNARSSRPVGVVDRQRTPILSSSEVYGGCKGKINVTFYPYSNSGNNGVGVALNGVQKIADGESFGGGRPSVESMFDLIEDDDLGLEDTEEYNQYEEPEEIEEEPPARRRALAKKAAAPAKKAAAPARKRAAAKPVEIEEGEEDLYDDLDDDI